MKNLTALMCALILIGFGALAAAEPAASAPSAQPSLDVAPLFLSQGACQQTLSSDQVLAPLAMAGCAGGLYGPCNTNSDCKGYSCPLGEIRYCFGGTGSGCQGSCGCW
jgi:hypothetical protein